MKCRVCKKVDVREDRDTCKPCSKHETPTAVDTAALIIGLIMLIIAFGGLIGG